MPEVRLELKADDEISAEIEQMTDSLEKAEEIIEETGETMEETGEQVISLGYRMVQLRFGVGDLLNDFDDMIIAFEDMGVITEEQSERFEDLSQGIWRVVSITTTLIQVQETISNSLELLNTTAKTAKDGMDTLEAGATATGTSMGLLAAKVALVVGAGIGLGVVISTIVLGFTRMIKFSEDFRTAFSKSFEFSIQTVKNFAGEIGDLVMLLGGAKKAEEELSLTVEDARHALENQLDIVKPKNMEMKDFIRVLSDAGASEEQLHEAAKTATVTFEKQLEAETKLKTRLEEVTEALQEQRDITMKKGESLEEFIEVVKIAGATEEQLNQAATEGQITFEKEKEAVDNLTESYSSLISATEAASIQERLFGVSAEQAALSILNQQEVVRGKYQPLEEYENLLRQVGLSEKEIAAIINEGIWPWEKQKEAIEEATKTIVKYNRETGMFEEQQVPATFRGRTERPLYLENALNFLIEIEEQRKKEFQLAKDRTDLLKEEEQTLKQILEFWKELIRLSTQFNQVRSRDYIGRLQGQATDIESQLLR